MEVFFNELSLKGILENLEMTRLFEIFSYICNDISKITGKIVVSYHKNTEQYLNNNSLIGFIFSIVYPNLKNREMRSSFISMFSKNPILINYPEYKYQGLNCYGLGSAFYNDSISISLKTNSIWDQNEINISEIIIDEEANIQENEVFAKNISSNENIEFHKFFIKDKVKSIKQVAQLCINNGKDLLDKQEIFENLIFCNEVHNFLITNYLTKTAEFNDILYKFNSLNSFFNFENINPVDLHSKILGRPRQEHETRRRIIEDKISISFSDNKKRNFFWHIDTYNSNGRIHFSPDFENKKCYIGYIGPKIL
jgi:hypothetical protein